MRTSNYLVLNAAFALALAIAGGPLSAQDEKGAGTDQAPAVELRYPTLLKVSYEAGAVLCDFETVEGGNATYRIYRSLSPVLDAESLASAELAVQLSPSAVPYRDTPEEEGRYYYAAVAVVDDEEQLVFVPYQNVSVAPVDYVPIPRQAETLVLAPLPGNRLSVRFGPSIRDQRYYLYVGAEPLKDLGSLSRLDATSSTAVDSPSTDVFELAVREAVPYYFAVTAVNRLGVENRSLTPGENATLEPFEIRAEPPKEPPKAEIPKVKAAPPAPKRPAPGERIDRNLKSNFFRGRYAEALASFLALLEEENLSSEEKATVHFYAGQCCFYLGEYREAVRFFVLSKEDPRRHGQSETWIERCLERIY